MSIQEKFEKAVNVIRNLPKNGSYQPSHEMQLRFYAYYKQATEGFNYHPKPNFWEVIKRAKWDAWAKLGNMTKEEAMIHYVEELRKIVETMSYTDNVANFLNSLDNFYEHVPPEDLEMLVGPIIEKMRSRPDSPLSNSPLASRDTSPTRTALSRDASPLRRTTNTPKHITSSLETSPASSYSASPLPPDTDDEDDFLDTQTEPDRVKDNFKKVRKNSAQAEDQVKEPLVTQELHRPPTSSHQESVQTEVTSLVPETVQVSLNGIMQDIDQLKGRLHVVEHSVSHQPTCAKFENLNANQEDGSSKGSPVAATNPFKKAVDTMTRDMALLEQRMFVVENLLKKEATSNHKRRGVLPRWWGLPLHTTAILLAWPVLILLVSKWLSQRKRH